MIDFDKFAAYSKAGPRYTSYPTAVEFTESFHENDFLDELQNSNKTAGSISLYFHLPFCRSACYFCGCNVLYTSKDEKKDRYIDYLAKELDILAKRLDTTRTVSQLHFGGGTPTFFDAAQLERIIGIIRSHFPNFDAKAEISCEIDPRFFNEEQMKVMAKGGFNRISFGVQDFDETVQAAVHRLQSFEVTKNAVKLARSYGIESINVDLIYGLPHQSLHTFKTTLAQTIELDPDRFAVFNYAHVPWMKKTMRKLDETTLPTPAEKLKILKYTMDYMKDMGYKTVGMDHFAKPDDELFKAIETGQLHRNFQGYTTKGGSDLIGVGVTSISELAGCYSQNHKDLESYEKAIDEGHLPIHRGVRLDGEDKLRKSVIMELMSNFSLDITRCEKAFGIDFKEHFKDALALLDEYVQADMLTIGESKIEANQTGSLLIRNIAMAFDAYFDHSSDNKNKFSKTI
jgi:oxygen-independent coproporphyrinogen III oxidase